MAKKNTPGCKCCSGVVVTGCACSRMPSVITLTTSVRSLVFPMSFTGGHNWGFTGDVSYPAGPFAPGGTATVAIQYACNSTSLFFGVYFSQIAACIGSFGGPCPCTVALGAAAPGASADSLVAIPLTASCVGGTFAASGNSGTHSTSGIYGQFFGFVAPSSVHFSMS